ncbi:antiviral reverse transcriptase Drt3a [Chryseobacterium rhizosphaerae]|uniref:antiviral reverse transcriptase Drt3a n=1 Tax=Chryseobacterium rhizosphaerae TaxID=395937 RepID=UPI0023589586|nr:antiviral reverse transcriptase Drt3a [Chryseobacterium rhizosphaerae]MDC8100150.1 RNA-directed DNA polymerase [Chryseobacterium rhizosphaerae]
MLDQSFSSKSFQEIFDNENRKGVNVEEKFNDIFSDSIDRVAGLKQLRKRIQEERNLDRKKVLYEEKKALKKERDALVTGVLDEIADGINNHIINLDLGEVYGKQSYKFENNAENFFISKKIQDNINRTYHVKQASRYAILSELINQLEDNFPKYVIRTDIKNFYESIPQKKILDKINNDYLLSIKTKKFIQQIFTSYNALTGQTNSETAKGVPRGVGISAYLSELFMRSVDNKIRELEDLVYYARYVDDIIVIFIPKSKNIDPAKLSDYRTKLTDIIVNEGLIINNKKTSEYNLLDGLLNIRFSDHNNQNYTPKIIHYLGYDIGSVITYKNNGKIDRQDLSVKLSDHKINKYCNKIKLSFQYFDSKKNHNRKNAFKLLSARINYLTSNTKLRNNKDKVFVGIYYSNPFLNSDESLETIQRRLQWYILRAGLSPDEKIIIMSYSFISGFKERTFQILPLKNKKYKNYNKKRSHTNNQENKGILQFGIAEINSIWKK